jgi:hypothetical protein
LSAVNAIENQKINKNKKGTGKVVKWDVERGEMVD